MPQTGKKRVIVIGGGMAGFGAALRLLASGYECTILEAQSSPGGLAGHFEVNGRRFPLGYHHILAQDAPLLSLLKDLGLWNRVAWKKGNVCFSVDGSLYDLENIKDFIRFPLPWADKLRFAAFMLYCFLKKDWSRDLGDAKGWLDRLAGERVRTMVFDPLMHTKYGISSDRLSANWLGSRLHYREFSRPLGYIPGLEWTAEMVSLLSQRVRERGGTLLLNARVEKVVLGASGARHAVRYVVGASDARTAEPDIIVNTAPPHVFRSFCEYPDPRVMNVEYLDALSLIMEMPEPLPRQFYLLSSLRPAYSFGGMFVLSDLNRDLGTQGGTVVNFFTTLGPERDHLRHAAPDEVLNMYLQDFERIFSFRPVPIWHRLNLIKNYSPKFLKQYENVSQRSRARGLYFAGNYLTYPEITSTGSAFASGQRAAEYIIADYDA